MALQMHQALAAHIADLVALDRVQRVAAARNAWVR